MPRTCLALLLLAATAAAQTPKPTDLHIALTGPGPLNRVKVHFQCDASATKLGLPAASFDLEYINGAGTSLAVLPVEGRQLIFANVIVSGYTKYVASHFVWAGRQNMYSLSSVDESGKELAVTQCLTH
jgi:membrane-bound inhibitor of C-type lysozyme